MVKGTQTLRGAFQSVFLDIGQMALKTFLDMGEQWARTQLTQMILGKTSATANIASNAASAGSGAYAATAAIPYVGPALAPAAAATAYSGALAYEAVAERGYDIPAGVNPVTQLHAREMVLPANIADPLRQSLSGGGQNAGDVHLHLHTPDAEGARRFLLNNHAALGEAMRRAARNFTPASGLGGAR
jgi:hypothetical protein